MRRLLRAEIILPITIIGAGFVLGVSEFLTTFELTPPGAEPLDQVTAADQHSYALLMLAIVAVGSMMLAVGTGQRAFSFAAAGFGVAAMLLFLIIDLPDAGKLGTLGGDTEFTYSTARAEPQTGFVLEAIGSVVLGLATVAFATLSSSQLQAPLALFGSRRAADADAAPPPTTPPPPLPREEERPRRPQRERERAERPHRHRPESSSATKRPDHRASWLSRRLRGSDE